MKRIFFILLMICLVSAAAFAQTDRKQVRQGNRIFKKENYQEAEISYKKALLVDSLSNAANYNLGNTFFKMENYQEADKYFNNVADSLGKGKNGASIYHNMGNSLLAQKNYQGAVDAYKDALRRNPSDMETKANLAYAQKMLQNQQQNQNNQDQNNQDQNNQDQNNQDQNQNQDQNDQNQNQDQNDQNKDNQDQNDNKDQNNDQNQNDQNQNDQNNNGQGQTPPPKISQQDAQQMLQAIQAKEDETQEKVKKEKALMLQSKQKEKNW